MPAKIALGFGNNVDYEIVWDSRVFEELVTRYAVHADELSATKPIESERDLIVSILGFMQRGAGGERFVAATAIIEEFARRFAMKITLGGTAVRAAMAMRKLGYTSTLHLVTLNDHVRRLLPAGSTYVCSNAHDTLYPHLIVQFDQGSCVRAGDVDIRAPRANRLIYHNDVDNIAMQLDADFANLLATAEVLLVSGFNAMQSEALLTQRLASLLQMTAALPANASIFYEDAGFYDPCFSSLIYRTLAHKIGVASLNEDELHAHIQRRIDLLDAAQIEDALVALHRVVPVPTIVVHSMFWALAYGEGAMRYAEALRGGVTMATARFRCGDDFTAADYHKVAALPPQPAAARCAMELQRLLGSRICCIPVAQVEQANGTTIGLGDAFVGGFLPRLLR